MIRPLLRTPSFIRAAKRLFKKHPEKFDRFQITLECLHRDVFDTTLRTHKLKGELAGAWASTAGYDLRIIFQLVPHVEGEAILLMSIGTHDEVY